jgi:hypothetical protein
VAAGYVGGSTAANVICQEILARAYPNQDTGVESKQKIHCKVFLDVEAFIDQVTRIGIVPNASVVEDFIRGFNATHNNFEIVDVRPSPNNEVTISSKMLCKLKLESAYFSDNTAMLVHHYFDIRCTEMYLGIGSNTPALAQALSTVQAHRLDTIKLLISLPLPPEYDQFAFDRVRLDQVFRNAPYPVTSSTASSPAGLPPPSLSMSRQTSSNTSDRVVTPAPAATPASAPAPNTWAAKVKASMEKDPEPVDLTSRPSRPSTPVIPRPKGHQSTNSFSNVTPGNVYTPVTSYHDENGIPRTEDGHRVDPQPKPFDRADTHRIKLLKVCNAFYLQDRGCPKEKCNHSHEWAPKNETEIEILRGIARLAPCSNSVTCSDTNCMYGHHCPAAKADKDKADKVGGYGCVWGKDCRYTEEMHGHTA